MSSLQKFHRRTLYIPSGPVTWPPTAIGGGDATNGYWLGDGYFNALIVAPKSTEVLRVWGSYGTVRNTTNTTNGLANTNTLYAFGSAAHPAAYYAKALTTGGYNSWYLPAQAELNTLYSNKSATPFATANSFIGSYFWSSTEKDGSYAYQQSLDNGYQVHSSKAGGRYVRATRRVSFATTVGQGSATSGYWLGNTGLLGSSKLIAAPKSTEVQRAWGSYGTLRSTTSTNDGLANTNTLYAFGAAAHPAAYYAKALTTGGYNTWYLPAKNELNTLYSNKSAVPFATANSFLGAYYLSSTELTGYDAGNANAAWNLGMISGTQGIAYKNDGSYRVRAVRAVEGTLAIGGGNDTQGYWLGTAGDGVSKLIAAPKSTEVSRAWGSSGTVRNTTSTTNGVANTTTLFGFGAAAHPAAYYAKALTTGGYNTWYLPAKNELNTLYSNQSAVPFATANSFVGDGYWSSTEVSGSLAWNQYMNNGYTGSYGKGLGNYYVRAVRRV